jgi:hypothetical protein
VIAFFSANSIYAQCRDGQVTLKKTTSVALGTTNGQSAIAVQQ